jgi:hypothetical protein
MAEFERVAGRVVACTAHHRLAFSYEIALLILLPIVLNALLIALAT